MLGMQEDGVHIDLELTRTRCSCVRLLLEICVCLDVVASCVLVVCDSVACLECVSYSTVWWLFGGSTNGSLFLLQLLPNAHVRSVLVFYDMAFTCGGFHLRVLLIGVGCGALRR